MEAAVPQCPARYVILLATCTINYYSRFVSAVYVSVLACVRAIFARVETGEVLNVAPFQADGAVPSRQQFFQLFQHVKAGCSS